MKSKLLNLLVALAFSAGIVTAAPLGTAFTYQGRLMDGANAAHGIYDLRFAVYDAAANGAQVGTTLTNTATGVSNGLFTVTLDFGSGIFTGAARWLAIEVRTNGSGTFTPLAPRQPLTPAPYSLYAPSAGTAASAVVANSTAANAVNTASLQANSITTDRITNGAVTVTKLDPSIGVWNKSGSDLFYNAGNVGIGTENPAAKLDVAGKVKAGDLALGWEFVQFPSTARQTEFSHNLYWDYPDGPMRNRLTGPGTIMSIQGGAYQPSGFGISVSRLLTNAPPNSDAQMVWNAFVVNSNGDAGVAGGLDLNGDFKIRHAAGGLLIGSIPYYYSDLWHNLYWDGSTYKIRNTGPGPGVMLRMYGGANEPGAFSFQVSPLATSDPAGRDAGLDEALRINADRSINASGKINANGGLHATGGLIIETRTSDPPSPVTGQIWLRTDL